jgi:hypothetical protein
MAADITLKVVNQGGELETLPQVALPVSLTKNTTTQDRTINIVNVGELDLTFFFPTAHDRNAFEDPSQLVDGNAPKTFTLTAGAVKSFVVRPVLGLIKSHPMEDNRVYSFKIETNPAIPHTLTDHEVGHVEC